MDFERRYTRQTPGSTLAKVKGTFLAKIAVYSKTMRCSP